MQNSDIEEVNELIDLIGQIRKQKKLTLDDMVKAVKNYHNGNEGLSRSNIDNYLNKRITLDEFSIDSYLKKLNLLLRALNNFSKEKILINDPDLNPFQRSLLNTSAILCTPLLQYGRKYFTIFNEIVIGNDFGDVYYKKGSIKRKIKIIFHHGNICRVEIDLNLAHTFVLAFKYNPYGRFTDFFNISFLYTDNNQNIFTGIGLIYPKFKHKINTKETLFNLIYEKLNKHEKEYSSVLEEKYKSKEDFLKLLELTYIIYEDVEKF